MDNPYDPPREVEVLLDEGRTGASWLGRSFGVLLWGGAAFIGFCFVYLWMENYYSGETASMRVALYSVFATCPVAWAPAGYFFWTGAKRKFRWLLVTSPTIVFCFAVIVSVIFGD